MFRMSPSAQACGLVAAYPGSGPVLRGVDLAAGRGMLVLLGPTGAGKTTLLRVLAGQLPPQAGEVAVGGADAAAAPLLVRERIGYVPQEIGLPHELTLLEYLSELLAIDGVPRAARGDRARAAAGRVHLRADLHRRMRRFSGGMRRRALIAQALLRQPEVWLLDEPTSGLDPVERLTVLALLRELAEEACVIAATHFSSDAAGLPGHVAVLDEGHVVWAGATGAFLAAAAGHVWEVDGAAPVGPAWLAQPASQPGRVRVVGAGDALPPGCAGRPAEPTADDAYFATLLRARMAAAGGGAEAREAPARAATRAARRSGLPRAAGGGTP